MVEGNRKRVEKKINLRGFLVPIITFLVGMVLYFYAPTVELNLLGALFLMVGLVLLLVGSLMYISLNAMATYIEKELEKEGKSNEIKA